LQSLDARAGGSLLVQLAGLFRADTPRRVAAIKRAITDRDVDDLLDAAHSLKGSCAVLGAVGMFEICQRLEDFGGRAEFEAAAVAADDLDAWFARTLNELDAVAPPRP
jgi:HPt (histidine-containing phosphotransfer) domain-containing protein